MNIYLYNLADGKVEHHDIHRPKLREMIESKKYRMLTIPERMELAQRVKKAKTAPYGHLDVHFIAPTKRATDGYGTTGKQMKELLNNHAIFANDKFCGQDVGVLYHLPYQIAEMETRRKILYTMFESTKMPPDWGKYMRMADIVLTPSQFCADVMKKQFGIEAVVLPLGIDTRFFKYIERPRGDTFTFLHYDAFKFRKGWDLVLNAFEEEFGDDEPVELIFKTTRESVPPLHEYKNVKIIQKILKPEEFKDFMREGDCFVFPTRGEGFGLTPLEAMATGMPAIVSRAGGIAQYYDPFYMFGLHTEPIRAQYGNSRFGTDLGDWAQPSIAQIRLQMRRVFDEWTTDPDDWKKRTQEVATFAKKYSIEATTEKLAKIIYEQQNSVS